MEFTKLLQLSGNTGKSEITLYLFSKKDFYQLC